jgi:hypothetical protein
MVTRRTLWAALALAALGAGLFVAARRPAPPPTDEELIRAAFIAAARAASERKAGEVMQLASERFHGGGLDRREVHQVVVGQLLRSAWASATVAGLSIEAEGARARANVDVILAGATAGGKGPSELLPDEASAYRFRCGLEREAEGWRVVTAEWQPISLADALAGPPAVDAANP